MFFSDGKNAQFARIQYECIRCLKAIMNSTVGLKQMFGHKEALTVIARSLDINKPAVMLEAVKVLAAVSLIPPNGHEKALEAITMSADIENRCRFLPIVQGLKTIGNEALRVSKYILVFIYNIFKAVIKQLLNNVIESLLILKINILNHT